MEFLRRRWKRVRGDDDGSGIVDNKDGDDDGDDGEHTRAGVAPATKFPRLWRFGLSSRRSPPVAPRKTLSDLPTDILEGQILEQFLVGPETLNPIRPLGIDVRACETRLAGLRSVSRSWRATVDGFVHRHQRRVHVVTIQTASRDELARILGRLRVDGSCVEQLEIIMGHALVLNDITTTSLASESDALEAAAIDWLAMLQCVPHLRRLDITMMIFASKHVRRILRASAVACPMIQALACPISAPRSHDDQLSCERLLEGLCRGLKRWHEQSGGLRAVQIPYFGGHRYPDRRAVPAPLRRALIRAILKFCPNLEYLEGWKATQGTLTAHNMRCASEGLLDCGPWRRFCDQAKALREFSFALRRSTNRDIADFAASSKPRLTALHMGGGRWTPSTPSADILPIFRAVPGLLVFDIAVDFCQRFDLDDVATAVASHCLKLQSFVLSSNSRLCVLTDRALVSLAQLPDLAFVRVFDARIIGPGIKDLLSAWSAAGGVFFGRRYVDLAIVDVAHPAIVSLLQWLVVDNDKPSLKCSISICDNDTDAFRALEGRHSDADDTTSSLTESAFGEIIGQLRRRYKCGHRFVLYGRTLGDVHGGGNKRIQLSFARITLNVSTTGASANDDASTFDIRVDEAFPSRSQWHFSSTVKAVNK